jgi:CBS-domain-containing membrane protein
MKAQDIMTSPVITVERDTSVRDIARLLLQFGISAVPVVDEKDQVVGIVSRANLLRALAALEPHLPEPPEDARALRREVLRSIREAGTPTSLLNVIVEGGRVQIWGLAND